MEPQEKRCQSGRPWRILLLGILAWCLEEQNTGHGAYLRGWQQRAQRPELCWFGACGTGDYRGNRPLKSGTEESQSKSKDRGKNEEVTRRQFVEAESVEDVRRQNERDVYQGKGETSERSRCHYEGTPRTRCSEEQRLASIVADPRYQASAANASSYGHLRYFCGSCLGRLHASSSVSGGKGAASCGHESCSCNPCASSTAAPPRTPVRPPAPLVEHAVVRPVARPNGPFVCAEPYGLSPNALSVRSDPYQASPSSTAFQSEGQAVSPSFGSAPPAVSPQSVSKGRAGFGKLEIVFLSRLPRNLLLPCTRELEVLPAKQFWKQSAQHCFKTVAIPLLSYSTTIRTRRMARKTTLETTQTFLAFFPE